MPALLVVVTVSVVVPVVDSELGLNVIVSPLSCPDALNLTAEVTVPASVIVVDPDEPRVTEIELGDAEIV